MRPLPNGVVPQMAPVPQMTPMALHPNMVHHPPPPQQQQQRGPMVPNGHPQQQPGPPPQPPHPHRKEGPAVEVSFQLSREKAKLFKEIAEKEYTRLKVYSLQDVFITCRYQILRIKVWKRSKKDQNLIIQLQRFGIHSIRFQGN